MMQIGRERIFRALPPWLKPEDLPAVIRSLLYRPFHCSGIGVADVNR